MFHVKKWGTLLEQVHPPIQCTFQHEHFKRGQW